MNSTSPLGVGRLQSLLFHHHPSPFGERSTASPLSLFLGLEGGGVRDALERPQCLQVAPPKGLC
eukprot:6951538-Pyramimonas_sp.AAC.1